MIPPQRGRPGFDPRVGKIPWRKERIPTPAFWPREYHGLHTPWSCKELDTTEWLSRSSILDFVSSLMKGLFLFYKCASTSLTVLWWKLEWSVQISSSWPVQSFSDAARCIAFDGSYLCFSLGITFCLRKLPCLSFIPTSSYLCLSISPCVQSQFLPFLKWCIYQEHSRTTLAQHYSLYSLFLGNLNQNSCYEEGTQKVESSSCFIHPLVGTEYSVADSKWDMDSTWHTKAVQLLNYILMVNLDHMQMERISFVDTISLVFEKYERNCTYKQWHLVTLAEYHWIIKERKWQGVGDKSPFQEKLKAESFSGNI